MTFLEKLEWLRSYFIYSEDSSSTASEFFEDVIDDVRNQIMNLHIECMLLEEALEEVGKNYDELKKEGNDLSSS